MAAGVDAAPISRSNEVVTAPGGLPNQTTPAVLKNVKIAEKKGPTWNTKNLGSRLAVDAACAATAGGMVAPLISMIDKAIIENASGKRQMGESLKASFTALLFRPHRYLTSKPFLLILMLYSGTYVTANALDTLKSTTRNREASKTTSGPSKFAATSAANLSLCLYKDSQFTKMFGTASARPIPPVTYALFAIRDSLTIYASFNLPPLLAPNLPLSEAAEKYISRASAAQFLAPAAVQLISTPFHLLGLDLYNRNGGTPFSDRMRKVRVDWLKSSIARMCRIVPAFGFGGVVNNGMRARMMKRLE
ncbi:hypothetical protein LTR62_008897 [Meristemomyces frigidus]|uniref:Sequence orphan n=1 Tax=Meristemomyces frigidus TaxID=1508187 RepID=A0AAN7T9G1_9PEZI|nr:hypothetical protein LTR62_008897 [Meristemomyces frigidus]